MQRGNVNANSLLDSNTVQMTQNANNGSGRVKLTPEHMRSLMKQWSDPLDVLFDKHRLLLYKTMELAARDNLFETEYVVQDEETADDARLDLLYRRLMRWAQKSGFSVRVGGRVLRSMILSWDPLATPDSVTTAEVDDPQSVAARRIRAHRSFQGESSSPDRRSSSNNLRDNAFFNNPVGFLQNPLANIVDAVEHKYLQHQQRQREQQIDNVSNRPQQQQQQLQQQLPAQEQSNVSHTRYSHLIQNLQQQQHTQQEENSHLARRARAVASRAAAIAGEQVETDSNDAANETKDRDEVE